jgi:hypothetical protein
LLIELLVATGHRQLQLQYEQDNVMRFLMSRGLIPVTVALIFSSDCSPAMAAVIFSDNFNDYLSIDAPNAQLDTGLTAKALGSLAGWTASGTNAIHAVDRGAGNWAPMFYDSNAITLSAGIVANALGNLYTVSFDGAPAGFTSPTQVTVGGTDFLHFAVLNNSNAVIAAYDYDPVSWPGTAGNPFTAGGFTYTGDGSGDVRLMVSADLANGHFGGAIDNLSISGPAAFSASIEVPEPSSMALLFGAIGMLAVRRTWRRKA